MAEQIATVNGGVISPFVNAWPFDGTFGVKHNDPPTPIPAAAKVVVFAPAADYIAIGHNTTPFVTAYAWSDAGFGAKVTNPVTLPPESVEDVAWRPQGDYIAVGHALTPFLSVYAWSGGFGAKVADPAVLPTPTGQSVAWSRDGLFLAVGTGASPFIHVYPFNPAGAGSFGAEVAAPVGGPTGVVQGIDFAHDDSFIAMGSGASPFVHTFPWTGVFGTVVPNPATLPVTFGQQARWDGDDSHLVVVMNGSPFMRGYPFSKAAGGSYGAIITAPSPALPGIAQDVQFNVADGFVAFGHFTTPFVSAYAWNGSAFGAKVADPAVLQLAAGKRVSFIGSSPPPPAVSAALTGTVLPAVDEENIRAGARTIIGTLTSAIWDATVGADNAVTTALINGLVSNGVGPDAWNVQALAVIAFGDVTRDSDTQVTIVLPAIPDYDIDFAETVTWTIPASATDQSGPIAAPPTFTITALVGGGDPAQAIAGGTRGQQSIERSLIQIRDALLGLLTPTRGTQAAEVTALQVLDILRGGPGVARGQQSIEKTMAQIQVELGRTTYSTAAPSSLERMGVEIRELALIGAFPQP